MNEIIEKWKKLDSIENEHQLFNEYKNAREEYLSEIRKTTQGEFNKEKIQNLLNTERNAFNAYVSHRKTL